MLYWGFHIYSSRYSGRYHSAHAHVHHRNSTPFVKQNSIAEREKGNIGICECCYPYFLFLCYAMVNKLSMIKIVSWLIGEKPDVEV